MSEEQREGVRRDVLERMLNDLNSFEALMDKCSSCAFCEATCPVYLADLLETHVARSRMLIIREALLKESLPVSERTREIIDRCLLCSRCKQTCPAAVPVNEIVIAARHRLYGGKRLSLPRRLVQKRIMENRGPGGIMKTAASLARAAGLVPQEIPRLPAGTFNDLFPPGAYPPRGKTRAKVVYFVGCGTNALYPDTGRAVMKVLACNGIEVTIPQGMVCCGLPTLAEGDVDGARRLMKTNLAVLAGSGADAVLTDCTSCGLTFKEMLPGIIPPGDPLYEQAVEVSSKITEVTDFLVRIGIEPPPGKLDCDYTYHVPCHGGWTPTLNGAPRRLLSAVGGGELRELDRPEACCGAGGAFFMDNGELSQKIRAPRLEDIRRTAAAVLITQCPSCRSYLAAGLQNRLRVMHPVALLASAYGEN